MILARELTQRPGVKANIAVTRAELGLGQRQDIKKSLMLSAFSGFMRHKRICAHIAGKPLCLSVHPTTVGRGWKGSWTMDISEEEFSEEIKQ